MRKIVIEVSGGNIQNIYSTEKENDAVAIYVIDWDNIENGEIEPLSEFPFTYCSKKQIEAMIGIANKRIKENQEDANT